MRRPLSGRIYRRLLRVFPPAFRAEYEEEMLATFAERRASAIANPRRASLLFWIRECVALLRAAWRVRTKRSRRYQAYDSSERKRNLEMTALLRDVRVALRSFRRAPTFTVVAVFTLALGIGANTAIFSVVNGVLFTPLDFDKPAELATVWGEDKNYGQLPIATGDFRDIHTRAACPWAATSRTGPPARRPAS